MIGAPSRRLDGIPRTTTVAPSGPTGMFDAAGGAVIGLLRSCHAPKRTATGCSLRACGSFSAQVVASMKPTSPTRAMHAVSRPQSGHRRRMRCVFATRGTRRRIATGIGRQAQSRARGHRSYSANFSSTTFPGGIRWAEATSHETDATVDVAFRKQWANKHHDQHRQHRTGPKPRQPPHVYIGGYDQHQ